MRLVMHAAAVAVVKYTGLGGIRADITGALKVNTKEARELAGAAAEKAMMELVLEEDKGGCGGGGCCVGSGGGSGKKGRSMVGSEGEQQAAKLYELKTTIKQ